MLVAETMKDAVRLVEARSDDVHVLRVACVIPPEHGIGDMVGELDQARCARIDEEGRVGVSGGGRWDHYGGPVGTTPPMVNGG